MFASVLLDASELFDLAPRRAVLRRKRANWQRAFGIDRSSCKPHGCSDLIRWNGDRPGYSPCSRARRRRGAARQLDVFG